MIINTTAGKTYAVTTQTDCTVSTPEGILIATCAAGEQTLFVAPSAEVEVSDDAAMVTESFKGAPAGSSASRGLSDRQAQAVGEMVDASLYDTVIEPHTTAAGTDNANFKWCQFAPTRVLSGTVAAISMPCRTTASSLITTSPVYLSVFQLNADGEYEYAGTSENAVVQAIGQTSRWTFRKLQLTGRTMRLCPVPDTATQWTDQLVLGGRVTPVSGEDSKITPISGSGAYVAEAVLEYAHQEPKYATVPAVESHVSDTVVHITADERTTWNNKADASALSGKVNTATFNAHTGNATVHVTAEERQRWDSYYDEITITDENGPMGLMMIPSEATSGWYEARVGLSFVPAVDRLVSVYTISGDRDPVYNWDGIMEGKYTPWYNNTPVPNYATRGPSGLELSYDWADTNASLTDMGCILYIHHTQGTASPICGVSGAPEGATNWGCLVIRQLSN